MPIYEFACPNCRKIFSFFSKRLNPDRLPVCPKCGNKKLEKQLSTFALTSSARERSEQGGDGEDAMSEAEEAQVTRAMSEMEKDMRHLDENNPKHMARIMKKMKDMMPEGFVPKEMDVAIQRMESGEDMDKIEADIGDLFGEMMGGPGARSGGGGYSKDAGLYDY
jgi:putative FmdB family regulatory protein